MWGFNFFIQPYVYFVKHTTTALIISLTLKLKIIRNHKKHINKTTRKLKERDYNLHNISRDKMTSGRSDFIFEKQITRRKSESTITSSALKTGKDNYSRIT